MTTRQRQTAKDRARIDWMLHSPLHYDAAAAKELIACCLTAPPEDPITIQTFQVVDGEIEEKTASIGRSDATIGRLSSALNVFLIERALESEPSIGDTYFRLRKIIDAADHLKRALGMSLDPSGPQLPWPISRRFMQAMSHSGDSEQQRVQPSGIVTDTSSHYLARAQLNRTALSDALSGLNLIHQWAVAASRMEKSQLARRRKQPDLALARLVKTMSTIWIDVLGQDLRTATNNSRNMGRWTPIPESYQRFVAFVHLGMKPIAVEISVDEMRAAFPF